MDIRKKTLACLKILGMDTINRAQSGHPGIVLGAAPIIYSLFRDHLISNPEDSTWINRDRFVLSAGHGSALLYSMLHLAGYKISINDLKKFRSTGITPGHPEYRVTEGVDCTTGPLGQGIAMAVGMALAESNLAARFNQKNNEVINHYTYCLCGDGCLQEGISYEAMALAGHLKLNKLIVLYDSNNIQLDSETNKTTSENMRLRAKSQNWNYLIVKDGANPDKITFAIDQAKKSNKPTIIEIKTIIGAGTSLANTNKVHGAPISEDELNKLRVKLNYNYDKFEVAPDIYEHLVNTFQARSLKAYKKHQATFENYAIKFPQVHTELVKCLNGEINFDIKSYEELLASKPNVASRVSAGLVLDKLTAENPLLIGGSADLSASTKVKCNSENYTSKTPQGRNLMFGVREHAMAAIANGLTVHGGFRAFTGGFFVFSDYMKPAIRLSALMKLPVIYFFTHDSIHVGQDGPTHQPIEQLIALRSIPDFITFKPADNNEVIGCFDCLKDVKLPSAVMLTRQDLPAIKGSKISDVRYGAYIIDREKKSPQVTLIASGAEVNFCVETKVELVKLGYDVRVVSVPSLEMFKVQSDTYKSSIIPSTGTTIAVEAGIGTNWYKYAKKVFDIKRFGVSDSSENVLRELEFNVPSLVSYVKKHAKKN